MTKQYSLLKKFIIIICVIAILTTCITISAKYIIKRNMDEIIALVKDDNNEINGTIVNEIEKILKYSKDYDTFNECYLAATANKFNGKYKDAITYYEKAIEVSEDVEERSNCYRKLGILYNQTQDYTKAIECLNKTLSLNPKDKNALLYKAECYLQMSDYQTAISIINQYKLDYDLSVAQYETVITMFVTMEQYDEASALAYEASEKYPDEAPLFVTYSLQANALNNNMKKAREDAIKYIELTDNKTEPDIIIASYLYALEKYDKALEIYLDYIYNHDMLSLYDQAIECSYQLDDYATMLKLSNEALNYHEGDEKIEYYKWKAIALMQHNDFTNAIDCFNTYIETNPDQYETIYLRALCYFAVGKYSEAISDFSITYEANLLVEDSLYNRALCYVQIDDVNNAVLDLKAVVDLNSGSETYSTALELYNLLKETEQSQVINNKAV